MTPCKFSDEYQRCSIRCCQHLQGRTSWKREREIVYPRDGQNIFARNAGVYLRNFAVLVLSSFCFCVFLFSFFLHLFILLQIFFLSVFSLCFSVSFFYLRNFTVLVLSSFCFCVFLLFFFLHLFILLQIFFLSIFSLCVSISFFVLLPSLFYASHIFLYFILSVFSISFK